MANPKHKISKCRKRKRRSHLALSKPTASECPECLEPKRPHFACERCGMYKGSQVLAVKGV